MRQISSAFRARLDAGATTLCACWRVVRRDGVVQGFTDHDVDIVFDGVTYSAASGLDGSGFETDLGFAVGGAEAAGALSSASITERDLLNGAWDGARVEIWRVDWAAPEHRVLMQSGVVGEVRRDGARFVAELRSLAHALDQERGRLFGDAELGDRRCGVALSASPLAHETVVVGYGDLALRAPLPRVADGFYANGRITFVSGANAGASHGVRAHRDGQLTLWTAPASAPAGGDRIIVYAGCDKTFATCRDTFRNIANFRGFPHLPGNDELFAPASTGAQLDGGSLFR